MWVPLIENNEHLLPGATYFIDQHINQLQTQSDKIDTILLACTHYPLLQTAIKKRVASGTTVLTQGSIVADSLIQYLQRHQWMEQQLLTNGKVTFYTTDDAAEFDIKGSLFYGKPVKSQHIDL